MPAWGGHQLERVNAPEDDSTTATLCRTLYPHVVELALSAYEWSFATARANLAQKPDAGAPGLPYRYGLPADCLHPARLEGSGEDGRPPAYSLEGADLLTALNPAILVYTRQMPDPAAFPPDFADAISWGLAAELSTSLVNDARRQQYYSQKYEAALLEARTADLRRQQRERPVSPWIAARDD